MRQQTGIPQLVERFGPMGIQQHPPNLRADSFRANGRDLARHHLNRANRFRINFKFEGSGEPDRAQHPR